MEKKCSCGLMHHGIPDSARFLNDSPNGLTGWYWECYCGSTLFMPGETLDCHLMVALHNLNEALMILKSQNVSGKEIDLILGAFVRVQLSMAKRAA